MNRTCRLVSTPTRLLAGVLMTTLTIAIHSAQNAENKLSVHAAKVLLATKNIDPKSSAGEKDAPILGWMFRGENYLKPCKDSKLDQQRTRIVAVKKLYNEWTSYDALARNDLHAFNARMEETESSELLLAIQIYQKARGAKAFVHRLTQQLYTDIFYGKRALDQLLDQLQFYPTKIADIAGSDNGSCKNSKFLTAAFTTAAALRKKKHGSPFIWSGTTPKRVTVGNLTLATDPAKARLKLESCGEPVVSLECQEQSQLTFTDNGIIACAATLYPNKKSSRTDLQGALIINLASQQYVIIERAYPTELGDTKPIVPQVINQNGVIAINWRRLLEVYSPASNSILTRPTPNWIEEIHLACSQEVPGNLILFSRELPTGGDEYVYHMTGIDRVKTPLVDHLKTAASKNLGYLLSGVGFGKSAFNAKALSNEVFTLQHGADPNIDIFFEELTKDAE
ncbi:MAG: hypothetical protein M1549_00020 [Candidatus Dependentiae bacterium]|nr:hypothetical protein [Candidatus Dependentiae bacterium]